MNEFGELYIIATTYDFLSDARGTTTMTIVSKLLVHSARDNLQELEIGVYSSLTS